ncbi:MAG TPA: response regulator [Polyangiaceae bacterium]|nr:response regulator [Polyangiaceae bacterium]
MAVDACERRLSPRAAAQHTVLVVDDEPLMRLFVMRALRGAGYDTIEAASAEEALELLTADDGGISLLVSDVQLPGISGSQLVEQARDLLPDLPTLLMSGRGRHWLVNERLLQRDAELLQKPFRIADLLGKLEQLLAQ